jgi:hypothetical protein
MRNGIRQRLIQEIPLIGGRVVGVNETPVTLDKPYMMLVLGAEATDSPWSGFNSPFEVWPSLSQTGDFADVDALSELVIAALDGHVLADEETNEEFTCRYDGNVGPDKSDPDREVISRGLRFSTIAVRSLEESESVTDDSWLLALSDWTESLLNEDWQVYTGSWPRDYVRPSILWRLEGFESTEGSRSVFELRKRVLGHVIGRSMKEQTAAVTQLTEGLARAVKLPLDIANRRFLTVVSPVFDLKSDPLTEGQITLTLARKIERENIMGDSPFMQEIHFRPIL